MKTEVHTILQSFDLLPDTAKWEVASEILRRTLALDNPTLTNEDLVAIARERFLELERGESENA
jgi:hypothetical protein